MVQKSDISHQMRLAMSIPNPFASAFCTCEIVNAGFLNYQQYHQEFQVAKMKEVPLVIVLRGRGFSGSFLEVFCFTLTL